MANKPITLKRNNSGTVDNLYPKTTWDQIETNTIPDDFNPSSHSHGNITNGGEITASATIATGDHLVIADNSSGNDLTTSSITFDTSNTTQFLRKDGTFATPSDTTTLSGLGITATAAELNYTDGVTSNIQTQLNGKLDVAGDTATGSMRFQNDLNYFGLASGNNEAEIVINTGNAGHPQIGFTEHGDASWAIGIDDNDNGFKIHGSANSTIPSIGGLSTPHFELDTTGNMWLQKRLYLTSNAFIEYNSTNDSIDFFFN